MGSPPDGKRPQGRAVRFLKRRVPERVWQKAAIAGELAKKPAVCFFFCRPPVLPVGPRAGTGRSRNGVFLTGSALPGRACRFAYPESGNALRGCRVYGEPDCMRPGRLPENDGLAAGRRGICCAEKDCREGKGERDKRLRDGCWDWPETVSSGVAVFRQPVQAAESGDKLAEVRGMVKRAGKRANCAAIGAVPVMEEGVVGRSGVFETEGGKGDMPLRYRRAFTGSLFRFFVANKSGFGLVGGKG